MSDYREIRDELSRKAAWLAELAAATDGASGRVADGVDRELAEKYGATTPDPLLTDEIEGRLRQLADADGSLPPLDTVLRELTD